MLNVPIDFPHVGARALLMERGGALPCRIIQDLGGRGKKRLVQVHIEGRNGSSAARREPIANLVTAEPLSDAEQAEMNALDRELAGKLRPPAAKLRRFNELGQRWLNAERERLAAEAAERRLRGFRH